MHEDVRLHSLPWRRRAPRKTTEHTLFLYELEDVKESHFVCSTDKTLVCFWCLSDVSGVGSLDYFRAAEGL